MARFIPVVIKVDGREVDVAVEHIGPGDFAVYAAVDGDGPVELTIDQCCRAASLAKAKHERSLVAGRERIREEYRHGNE